MGDKQYHIGFDDTHGARYALLPGDPGRVPVIAKLLENAKHHATNREYTSWLGTLGGENVLVVSTGIGGPSTSIAVEELYATGVRNFIRVGTCGGISLDVIGGDVVIANAAVRMDGTPNEYVPPEFPAVANIDITIALMEAAKNLGFRQHVGIVQCKDSFYGQHSPHRMPVGDILTAKWEAWKKAGVLASEMESATLYVVAQVLGAKAGCVLSTVWNQEREAAKLDNPHHHDPASAIQTAVEATRLLISKGAGNV